MALYNFYPNGTPWGIYEGDDAKDALLTCAKDAGYPTLEAAAAVLGKDVDDHVDEMKQWMEEIDDAAEEDIVRKSKFTTRHQA